MSVTVSVVNRQRKLPVDGPALGRQFELIAEQVCAGLRQRPAPHLPEDAVSDFAERGVVSVVFVSNAQIRKINRQWRGKDAATDVISFPLADEAPPAGLPWEVGEVFISAERALSQSQEYGHDLAREYAFLFVHGLLHVLGFDHETADDEKEMFSRQDAALDALGIRR